MVVNTFLWSTFVRDEHPTIQALWSAMMVVVITTTVSRAVLMILLVVGIMLWVLAMAMICWKIKWGLGGSFFCVSFIDLFRYIDIVLPCLLNRCQPSVQRDRTQRKGTNKPHTLFFLAECCTRCIIVFPYCVLWRYQRTGAWWNKMRRNGIGKIERTFYSGVGFAFKVLSDPKKFRDHSQEKEWAVDS